MATHQRKVGGGGTAVLRNPRTGELKVIAYSRGTQYRYGSAENDALYKDWEVISPKEGGSLTADWLPTTRPGIVSRTADGAYGEHLKTRTPGVRFRAAWLPKTRTPAGAAPPTARYPQRFKKFKGNYMDWLTNAPAQLNQALSQLPAPLKNWLSNYPRLPQSTIPTPKDKYSIPGRPSGPSKPGYTNPFAWRRKNNGWW